MSCTTTASCAPSWNALGQRFRIATDTEVVLNAYAQWGVACVDRFNGMFGLAIWDRRKRQLFLARDRYGIKPLYYAEVGSLVLFGSEIKALLQHDGLAAAVSLPRLLEYFTFQNIFTDGTLFAGVKLLRPGHRILLDAERGPLRAASATGTSIFAMRTSGSPTQEYAEELDRLFRQAVSRQLVSTCRSAPTCRAAWIRAAITALAALELPHLNTFTVGFDMTSGSASRWQSMSASRPRRCPTNSRPSSTRWC